MTLRMKRADLLEAAEVCTMKAVGTKLTDKIDRELRSLGESVPD